MSLNRRIAVDLLSVVEFLNLSSLLSTFLLCAESIEWLVCYAAPKRSWSIEILMTLDNLSHRIHRITRWHREFRDLELGSPCNPRKLFCFLHFNYSRYKCAEWTRRLLFKKLILSSGTRFPQKDIGHKNVNWLCVRVKDKNHFRAMIISSSHVIGIIFKYIFKMLQVCHGLHYFSNNNFFFFATALSFWCTYYDSRTIHLNWGYYERVISPRRNKLNGYYYS